MYIYIYVYIYIHILHVCVFVKVCVHPLTSSYALKRKSERQ